MTDNTSILAHPNRIEANGHVVTFLRNPACYPYLREAREELFFRNGVPGVAKFESDGDHLVALEYRIGRVPQVGRIHICCRVWVFYSRDPYFKGGVPDEAVRPCDIVPGQETPRYQPLYLDIICERATRKQRSLAGIR